MFSAGEPYERFMGRWSRGLAPLLVRFAGIRDGDAVLDVGCGTGALTAAIAAAAPSSAIVAIDPSSAYVEAARARLPADRVQVEVGDGQRLRFEDATFDRTLSALMLNFVTDAGAVREMRRVTRSGGTVAAAVWDYGEGMQMLRVFWDGAAALDPAADARDERHMPLCRRGELEALWREHGFADVAEEPLTIPMRFASFVDFWRPFLEQQGPAGAYVAALPAGGARPARRVPARAPDRPGRGSFVRAQRPRVGGPRQARIIAVRLKPDATIGRQDRTTRDKR